MSNYIPIYIRYKVKTIKHHSNDNKKRKVHLYNYAQKSISNSIIVDQ